jgi:hypothetical protein
MPEHYNVGERHSNVMGELTRSAADIPRSWPDIILSRPFSPGKLPRQKGFLSLRISLRPVPHNLAMEGIISVIKTAVAS